MYFQTVGFSNGSSYGPNSAMSTGLAVSLQPPPLHFRCDHEPLCAIGIDRERCARTGLQRRIGGLDRALDVVRVVVPAVDDDQVLQSSRNKQFSLIQESQIPRKVRVVSSGWFR